VSTGQLAWRGHEGYAPATTTAPQLLIPWRVMVGTVLAVILFIPIKRYALPGELPFQFEPYRLAVFAVVAAWLVALLIDPRVRLRRSFLDAPLALIALGAVASDFANMDRVLSVGTSTVIKALTFLASFILVFWLLVSVARDRRTRDALTAFLVGGGAVVAGFAIIESRTHWNVFDHLHSLIPFLRLESLPVAQDRGALRAYGSAPVAIALGAALVMLIPLGIALARSTGRRRWKVAVLVLAVGALATVSRTAVLMLIVIGVVYLWLRPKQTRRLWPALLPALLVIHLALPGVLGTLHGSFFPKGGLIEEQRANAGTASAGRVADIGPTLDKIQAQPFFGGGYGTYIVDLGPKRNTDVLDDQWLGNLLEVGIVGTLGYAWLMLRATRRFGRAAKDDDGDDGWFFAGITATVAAFGIGMWTFDAFAFTQATFLLFVVLGLGAAALPRVAVRPARTEAAR
jgi:hypothetical protein